MAHYRYADFRDQLFTEKGQTRLLEVLSYVRRRIDEGGAVMLVKVLQHMSGDTWFNMACVDRLVELGYLREVTGISEVRKQDRVFIAGPQL